LEAFGRLQPFLLLSPRITFDQLHARLKMSFHSVAPASAAADEALPLMRRAQHRL